jgi:hypothetical protein
MTESGQKQESQKKAIFTITIYDNGDFDIFKTKTTEPLRPISDKELITSLFNDPIREKESVFSPILTYFKQNSGVVLIGGRRYKVP